MDADVGVGVGGEWVLCGCECMGAVRAVGGGGVWGLEHRRTPTCLSACLPVWSTDGDTIHRCYHDTVAPVIIYRQLLSRNAVPFSSSQCHDDQGTRGRRQAHSKVD